MPFAFHRPLELVARHEGRLLARCAMRGGSYLIGRDRRSDIVLEAPSISGRHARLIVASESEIYLEDLGSATGTSVDGQTAAGRTRLSSAARIGIGAAALEFQRAGLPPAAFEQLPDGFFGPRRYARGDAVGHGRDATIYAAHDLVLDREVALRVMLPESQAPTADALRFIRTVQVNSQLQHPNILPIYELGMDEDRRLFYTTRFIEGEPLADILERIAAGDRSTLERHRFPALLSIFQKTCDAVAFAHSRGVVHCALRPESITVGSYGKVFVVNWTHAKILASGLRAVGLETPPPLSHYTAPEQAVGASDEIDARSDVYALGGILHRIVTLTDPLDSPRCPRPHWPAGDLPAFLIQTAKDAMSTARADRHGSVLDLQRELLEWRGEAAARHEPLWKHLTGMLRL